MIFSRQSPFVGCTVGADVVRASSARASAQALERLSICGAPRRRLAPRGERVVRTAQVHAVVHAPAEVLVEGRGAS